MGITIDELSEQSSITEASYVPVNINGVTYKTDLNNFAKKSNIELNPDLFEGTDVQKLQQAFNYCIENNIDTINLNREYDITGSSIIYPEDTMWDVITFRNGRITKNDSGYVFDSNGSGNGRNAVIFSGTTFKSSAADCYLYNGDKIIRQNVNNCKFIGMSLVKTTNYIQTLRVDNCETGQLYCNFIEAKMIFDGNFTNNRCETSTAHHLIKIQSTGPSSISMYGLRITNNLIEGYVNTSPIVVGSGYGLIICDNYFEANNTSILIQRANDTVGQKLSVVINGNTFGATKSNYDIFFENINLAISKTLISIKYNTSNVNSGKYLCNSITAFEFPQHTNNLYGGGKVAPITGGIYPNHVDATYDATLQDNDESNSQSGTGISFIVPLHLNNSDNVFLNNKQYLVNIRFTFGTSVWYTGHITGILSIDGIWNGTENTVVQELHFTPISHRCTTGTASSTPNGNTLNMEYYFKETGTKIIGSTANMATIVFELPAATQNQPSYNKINVKNMWNILQRYPKDTDHTIV